MVYEDVVKAHFSTLPIGMISKFIIQITNYYNKTQIIV